MITFDTWFATAQFGPATADWGSDHSFGYHFQPTGYVELIDNPSHGQPFHVQVENYSMTFATLDGAAKELFEGWVRSELEEQARPKPTGMDPDSWISTVWNALEGYRGDCIPEGDEDYDAEWGDICTAMAWIEEEVSHGTDTMRSIIGNAAGCDDLDDACRLIQDFFGQTDGGVAGMHFGDHITEMWSKLSRELRLELLLEYAKSELNHIDLEELTNA